MQKPEFYVNLGHDKNGEAFARSENPAIPISSRRYLSAYEHVAKYLVFAGKDASTHKLRGINTKYLATAESGGISFEISSFRNSHSLF